MASGSSRRTDQATQDVADSVAQGAVGAVYRLGLKALVVPTTSGRTARLVSAHRPNVPVLAISPQIETVRRLSLLFGVTAVQSDYETDVRGLLAKCAALAARHGIAEPGDLIAITAGLPEQELGTNLFEVHRVPRGERARRGEAGARGQRAGRAHPRQPAAQPLRPADDGRLPGAIDEIAAEPPRALLIRAEGRAVSGGVDVHVFEGLTPEQGASSGPSCWGRSTSSRRLPAPIVFAAHALTLTAAFEIALACDLIVASPRGEVRPGRESGRADAVDGRHPAARRARRQRPRPPLRDDRRDLSAPRRWSAGAWST